MLINSWPSVGLEIITMRRNNYIIIDYRRKAKGGASYA